MVSIPKVILFDGANGPHLADFISAADDLDANVSAVLDNGILIVGPVRWCGVWVPLDITWNGL